MLQGFQYWGRRHDCPPKPYTLNPFCWGERGNLAESEDLFLTGDTSQTVSRAVEFRFCDLRSVFHDFNPGVAWSDHVCFGGNFEIFDKAPRRIKVKVREWYRFHVCSVCGVFNEMLYETEMKQVSQGMFWRLRSKCPNSISCSSTTAATRSRRAVKLGAQEAGDLRCRLRSLGIVPSESECIGFATLCGQEVEESAVSCSSDRDRDPFGARTAARFPLLSPGFGNMNFSESRRRFSRPSGLR